MTPKPVDIVRDLIDKVWFGRDEHSPTKDIYSVKKDIYSVKEEKLDAFETHLDTIIKNHRGTELKGLIYMIDLSKIRDRLGIKWTQSLDKIHLKIDGILHSQMTARDIYIQRDDLTYLLVFDALPHLQGHFKAHMIHEEIARALVGEAEAAHLTSVMDVTIDEEGNIQIVNAPSKDHLIAEIVKKADQERAQTTITYQYETPLILEDVNFIYRPMLVTRTHVVSTYVCVPVNYQMTGGSVAGYQVLGDTPSPQEIMELDHLTLHIANQELEALISAGSRCLIALPVHFETLASVKRRMKYLAGIENIMKHNTDRIIFEMVGLPENIPQPRILELTSALRSYSRAIIARFSVDHGHFPAYRTAGLHAVGIDVSNETNSEKALIRDMETFVSHAKQNQLRTYAHGIRSRSLLSAAICAGFDYLDGYALSSIVTGAHDVHPYDLRSPWVAYQKKAQ